MSPKFPSFAALLVGMASFFMAAGASAHVQMTSKLAEQLLYGDQTTRNQAVLDFNKLPSDGQEKLVPDFMVAMSDENPEVRKIASRILKAMGVKTGNQIPDAQKELTVTSTPSATVDKWAAEKKLREETIPDAKKALATPEAKPAGDDRWSDLTKMRADESGHYADMKDQMDKEKKSQVILDASQLRSGSEASATPFSTVIDSLKDPDPWVRSQAARRLAMVQPAPVEAIPTLINMLHDKEPDSRRAAVAALGSFGHLAKDAVLPLNAALSDPDPGVRSLAGTALQSIQQTQ